MSEVRDGELWVAYTLSELDDLQGHLAAAANRTDNSALRRKLDALYDKLQAHENLYEDESSPGAE